MRQTEHEIADLNPLTDHTKMKEYLDSLYWQILPQTRWGRIIGQVKPVGGRRKVEALDNSSTTMREPLSGWTVVGDSITDFKMLQAVNKAGGLAIAFDANEYALKYASMSLASVRLDDLWIVLAAWKKGARSLVEKAVKDRQEAGGVGDREWFHWLDEIGDVVPILEIHKKIRRLVRQEAADLG